MTLLKRARLRQERREACPNRMPPAQEVAPYARCLPAGERRHHKAGEGALSILLRMAKKHGRKCSAEWRMHIISGTRSPIFSISTLPSHALVGVQILSPRWPISRAKSVGRAQARLVLGWEQGTIQMWRQAEEHQKVTHVRKTTATIRNTASAMGTGPGKKNNSKFYVWGLNSTIYCTFTF